MKSEIIVFLAYGIGIFSVYFFGRLMLIPAKAVMRLLVNSLMGAAAIAALNIFGSFLNIYVPLNVINAFTVGLLGVPGAIMLLSMFI